MRFGHHLFRKKDQVSAKQLKAFLVFLSSEFDKWPIMKHRAALCSFFVFHFLCSRGQFPLPQAALVMARHWVSPLFCNRIGFAVAVEAFHLSNSQYCTHKYTQKPHGELCGFFSSFGLITLLWRFRTRLEERSNPTSAHCPVSSLHLLFGEKWGDRQLRKNLQTSALLPKNKANWSTFRLLFFFF